jgi:hypothetical protein
VGAVEHIPTSMRFHRAFGAPAEGLFKVFVGASARAFSAQKGIVPFYLLAHEDGGLSISPVNTA